MCAKRARVDGDKEPRDIAKAPAVVERQTESRHLNWATLIDSVLVRR